MRSCDTSRCLGISWEKCGLIVTFSEQSLNLGSVGWVRDEEGKRLAHAHFGKLELLVHLQPELLLRRGGSRLGDGNMAQIHALKAAHRGLVALIVCEVIQVAGHGESEQTEGWVASLTNELGELVGVLLTDLSLLDGLRETKFELVLTVGSPDTLEVGLFGELGLHLVRHDHILLLDDLRGHFSHSLILFLESCSTFGSASIHAEHNGRVLIGPGERVKALVTLSLSVLVEQVALLPSPAHLGHLVVEKSILQATSPVLEAEPLEGVGLLALATELLGCPLGLEVVHGVIPSLARVGIDVPAVHVLVLGPVRCAPALEDSPGASVEGNVTDALQKGIWVEVLGVQVVHHIRLLVELVAIHIFDTESYIIIKIKISTLAKTRRKEQRGLSSLL